MQYFLWKVKDCADSSGWLSLQIFFNFCAVFDLFLLVAWSSGVPRPSIPVSPDDHSKPGHYIGVTARLPHRVCLLAELISISEFHFQFIPDGEILVANLMKFWLPLGNLKK